MFNTKTENRLCSVDVLRGVAALLVVIYHARADYWIGVSNIWTERKLSADPSVLIGYATYPFSYGWFGVQIFFVLSGYCIHRRFAFELAQCHIREIDWKRFFVRRFIRIYPIYIAALICTAFVDYAYLGLSGGHEVGELSWGAFWASVFSVQGIVTPMFGTNTVFWTLSIEIHLYLFYPILFSINRNRGAKFGLAFAFAVSAAYVASYLMFDIGKFFPNAHGGGPVFLPFVFMWAAGAYLADVEAGRSQPLQGAIWNMIWISCLIGGFLVHVITDEVVSALPLAIGAAGLVHWFKTLELPRLTISTLMLPPFIALGEISYSLYSTHRIAFGIMNAAGFSGQSSSILKFVIATIVAIMVASLFYVLVEKASLNLSARFRGPRANVDQVRGEQS